ncbi:hypothetical protein MHYP_G00185260 [Metynnis hypsauchen]
MSREDISRGKSEGLETNPKEPWREYYDVYCNACRCTPSISVRAGAIRGDSEQEQGTSKAQDDEGCQQSEGRGGAAVRVQESSVCLAVVQDTALPLPPRPPPPL